MFETKVVEKFETHFMHNNFFFKSCRFGDNVEKCRRAGQATENNMTPAHCKQDT